MKEQKIVKVALSELQPNEWNPNQMTDKTYKKLKANIKEFGYLQPIVAARLNNKLVIVDGEHRWRAMQEQGIKEADIILLEGYTEAELKLLTINLNKLKGEFKPYELAQLIAELDHSLKNYEEYIAYEKEDIKDYLELLEEPLDKYKEVEQKLQEAEEQKPVLYKFKIEDEEYIFVIDGPMQKQVVEQALKLSKGIDHNHKFYNICKLFTEVMQKAEEGKNDKTDNE